MRNKYNLHNRTILTLIEGVAFKDARVRKKSASILYKNSEATKKIELFLSLPQTSDETGRHKDNEGVTWVSIGRLNRDTGISSKKLSLLGSYVATIQGKRVRGRIMVLYRESEIMEKINEFLALPKVDSNTGVYIDGSNRRWIDAEILASNIGHNNYIYQLLKRLDEIPSIQARGKKNHVTTLFDEAKAIGALRQTRLFKRKRRRQKNHTAPEEANGLANTRSNFDPSELSPELRQEILDRFAEFLEQNPDTQISVIDFTVDYLKKGKS